MLSDLINTNKTRVMTNLMVVFIFNIINRMDGQVVEDGIVRLIYNDI